MKKNNAGITLVSLVITVIVLLILSSIAVYSGVSTIRSARLTKFTTELKMMQQKVNELYDSYINSKSVTVNGVEYVGQGEYTTQNTEDGQTQTVQTKLGIQDIGEDPEGLFNSNRLEEVFSAEGSGITDRTGYMYYDLETIQALGLDDMEYEFFVNVATRSVVSIEGFNDYGTRYYTLDQVPNGVYNVDYISNGTVNFETTSEVVNGEGKIYIKNITATGYVNKWQVRYRIKAEEGENENAWTTTEEFTGNAYTINVPTRNLLDTYEIQVIHGNEIASSPQEYHILKVGDYINYTYDEADNYVITSEYTGSNSNPSAGIPQTKDLNWRILKVHDDGTIDLISEMATDTDIFFESAVGYNNAVFILNDICAKQYSNATLATTARSLNLDDVEEELNDQGIEEKNKYISEGNVQYGNFKLYQGIYPLLYAEENGTWTNISSEDITAGLTEEKIRQNLKRDGIDVSENGYTSLTTDSASTVVQNLIMTQSFYQLEVKSEYLKNSDIYSVLFEQEETYWLASRSINCYENYGNFAISGITNNFIGGSGTFNTDTGIGTPSRAIRPVVSLDLNSIRLVGDGREHNAENPHEIVIE